MKRFNYFVMSLISAAAFTFTACSSSDDLGGNSGKQEVAADGYYMTLTVKSPTAGNTTRTTQQGADKEEPGTDAESTITTGTIYLYDAAGKLKFSKDLTANDWDGNAVPTKTGTTKPFQVPITGINVGETYYVYFVANASKADYPNPLQESLLVKSDIDAAANAKFLMFNQNDDSKKANHSTVVFTEDSKNINNKVTADDISLDRTVARIDAPTVTEPKIVNKKGTTKTGNLNVISTVTYNGYTLTNKAEKSYLVQNWTFFEDKPATLNIPSSMTYAQPNAWYGTTYKAANLADFGNKDVNYVFENTTTTEADATGMYFKFTVTLKDEALSKAENKDFEDGTFLRYNNKIYASLKDLYDESNTEVWPFVNEDNSTMSYDDAIKKLKAAIEKAKTGDETELEAIRQATKIYVYVKGAVYYKYNINDQYYTPTGYFSVLRNSVYKLTVNNIWELGKDVPNGPEPPTEDSNYWMDVTVQVNPWVLNTIGVDLK